MCDSKVTCLCRFHALSCSMFFPQMDAGQLHAAIESLQNAVKGFVHDIFLWQASVGCGTAFQLHSAGTWAWWQRCSKPVVTHENGSATRRRGILLAGSSLKPAACNCGCCLCYACVAAIQALALCYQRLARVTAALKVGSLLHDMHCPICPTFAHSSLMCHLECSDANDCDSVSSPLCLLRLTVKQ